MAGVFQRVWRRIKSAMGIDGPAAPFPNYGSNQRRARASYDVAKSREAHWRPADLLSAAQANDPFTRAELRRKARYETANNSHCRGVTLTIANDLVGLGPQLQVMLPDGGETEVNETLIRNEEIIEDLWQTWADETCLAEKLNTMALSKCVDGEAFAILSTNNALEHAVKLDLMLVETDRVTSQGLTNITKDQWADGIEYDRQGNPTWYTILRNYPGETWTSAPNDFDRVSAVNVLHWFRRDRPGQVRGVPEILAALPLFSQLRRYTLAVLEAAETAADFAAILYTDQTPEGGVINADPWDSIEINKGTMTTVPAGWKMGQFEAEQPTATHDQFQQTILREIFHCLNMPYSVGSGDYSKDSYSSGRLGLQTYLRIVRQSRHYLKLSVLDRIFKAWLREVTLLGLVPISEMEMQGMSHAWYFDPFASIDPVKDANADQLDLANGVTTQMELCAERKRDWRKINRQRAREIADQKARGIMPSEPPKSQPSQPNDDTQDGGFANAA